VGVGVGAWGPSSRSRSPAHSLRAASLASTRAASSPPTRACTADSPARTSAPPPSFAPPFLDTVRQTCFWGKPLFARGLNRGHGPRVGAAAPSCCRAPPSPGLAAPGLASPPPGLAAPGSGAPPGPVRRPSSSSHSPACSRRWRVSTGANASRRVWMYEYKMQRQTSFSPLAVTGARRRHARAPRSGRVSTAAACACAARARAPVPPGSTLTP